MKRPSVKAARRATCPMCGKAGKEGKGCPTCPGFWFSSRRDDHRALTGREDKIG